MGLLKTYTIATDITKGILNHTRLESEIRTSGYVTNFLDISSDDVYVRVYGDSLSNESALGTLVEDHGYETLAELKDRRYNEIDYKTMTLIAPGFTYDGTTFSLSISAQMNWSSIKENTSDFTFPLNISTIDNYEYTLAEADVCDFWCEGRDTVKGHLDSGRALKKSVHDAADEAAVDVVTDTR